MTDLELTVKPEPRVVFRKRYACPFCRYQRSTAKPVVEHIERCWSNPAKRTCRTCLHFERGHATARFSAYEPPEAYDVEDECALGESLPENAPAVDCSLWRDRDLEDDEPAEDEWDTGLRELDGGR